MTASAVRQTRGEVHVISDAGPPGAASAPNAAWRVGVLRPSRSLTVRTRSRAAIANVPDYRARALALWPRLDLAKLRRTKGDVLRIARLVERRTSCSLETIVGMLTRESPD